jgi:hypothetical protein
VVVEIDKRTSLPTGSASVELDPGSDPVEAIKALQGQTCGGRPMKVLSQKTIIKKSRPSGGRADRYFLGGDVVFDVKCNSCGKGGHKTVDCDAGGQLNPCHLCAAKDHESGNFHQNLCTVRIILSILTVKFMIPPCRGLSEHNVLPMWRVWPPLEGLL